MIRVLFVRYRYSMAIELFRPRFAAFAVFAVFAVSVLVVASSGCSRGEEPAYAKTPNGGGPRITVIEVPTELYRPTAVANGVRLTGTVLFTGTRPQDSTVTPVRDQNVCDATIHLPTLSLQDSTLAEVVVWLADIRAGRPLPASRRFELVAQKCSFAPHVQAVAAGGTLNVRNDDAMIYRSHAIDSRWAGHTWAAHSFSMLSFSAQSSSCAGLPSGRALPGGCTAFLCFTWRCSSSLWR